MENKNFYVFVEGRNTLPMEKYTDLKKAEEDAQFFSNIFNKEVFILEPIVRIVPKEINEQINSFEAALEFLGLEDKTYTISVADKYMRAMVAIYKLMIIAEAWNKADDFIPDFSNKSQYKYLPFFEYDNNVKRFVLSSIYSSCVTVAIGSHICFKTKERAEQFGNQFIDLWNDFLLFN